MVNTLSFATVLACLAFAACAPTGAPAAKGAAESAPPEASTVRPAPVGAALVQEMPRVRVLQGSFTAPQFQDGASALRAEFTPTGRDGRWEVAFHFRFNGAQHVYRGTAEGKLEGGELRGTVRGSRQRTFTFACRHDRGQFRGTHAEVGSRRGGGNTGTLTLRTESL